MKKSMAGVFGVLLILGMLAGCASVTSFTCASDMSFTEEEYQKLSALQFDGYERFRIPEQGLEPDRSGSREPEVASVKEYAEPYTKLLAYKTTDYAQQSIADFNKALGGSPDTLSESLETYAEVDVSPEDENYDFFAVTLQASLNELYCEKFKEETFFHMTLSKEGRPYKEPDADGETVYAFWFNADAYLNYCIKSPDTLTVAERDKILTTFHSEMQKYVDGLSEAEITEGSIRKLLMGKGEDLAARLSSKSIILSFEVDRIEIEDDTADIQ